MLIESRAIDFWDFQIKRCARPFLGTDLTGRAICPDSFMTKSAGCNTPEDRIYIENTVSRPHYYEYINLSPRGMLNDETIEDLDLDNKNLRIFVKVLEQTEQAHSTEAMETAETETVETEAVD